MKENGSHRRAGIADRHDTTAARSAMIEDTGDPTHKEEGHGT
jgi:hypothetical protein